MGVVRLLVWGSSGHWDGLWQITTCHHLLLAISGKSHFGKDPYIFWQYTKKTFKIAFYMNSPKHDMSVYDFGLVMLLVKPI